MSQLQRISLRQSWRKQRRSGYSISAIASLRGVRFQVG